MKDLLSLKYSDLIQLASVKFSFYICSTKSLKTRIFICDYGNYKHYNSSQHKNKYMIKNNLISEKIISKALELFFKKGFNSVTMDDLSTELAMSKKTFYKIFPSKKKLRGWQY